MGVYERGSEGDGKGSIRVTAKRVGFQRSLDPILMDSFSRIDSTLIHRTHRVFTRKDIATTRRRPPASYSELTELSGDDDIARQFTLIGDSSNDEQRCDDLPNPP